MVAALSRSHLLAGLTGPVISRLAGAVVPRSWTRGQLICVEGEPGESLYVLTAGSVAVNRTAPSGSG